MGLDMELKQKGMEQKIRCSLPESWKARHREKKLRVLCCMPGRGDAC